MRGEGCGVMVGDTEQRQRQSARTLSARTHHPLTPHPLILLGLVDGFATAVLLTFVEWMSTLCTVLIDMSYIFIAIMLCVVTPWRGIPLVVALFERGTLSAVYVECCVR